MPFHIGGPSFGTIGTGGGSPIPSSFFQVGGAFPGALPAHIKSAIDLGGIIDVIIKLVPTHTWEDIGRLVGLTGAQAQAIYNELTGGKRGSDVTLTDEGCIFPQRKDADGVCRVFLGSRSGPDSGATFGRFGPAMVPTERNISRDVCLPGMVLGKDHLCYNARGEGRLANRNRLWPRGTRPLGTAEEMRAVRIASRFAKRFETTTKRMQKIGLAKKPAARARKPTALGPIRGGNLTVIDTE